ncbi:hypothetical protein [Sphingobacterium hotanense]|uniref:hypothetical protein n=1 Tax=Sphingobacterium hotanense TaxID=649196 RepID=UPI0011F2FE0D|nr:hypothetical protein [Sphingobacterium hotanense]
MNRFPDKDFLRRTLGYAIELSNASHEENVGEISIRYILMEWPDLMAEGLDKFWKRDKAAPAKN